MSDSPLPTLPPRSQNSHKGDFGRLLVIGGSRGMSGAVALAGKAALRSGAGLLKVATANVCADVVAGFAPEYMTIPLASDHDGRISAAAREQLVNHIDWATTIALGPGLGRSHELDDLVDWIAFERDVPMVIDADALNALAGTLSSPVRERTSSSTPPVLTPHPGEFQKLLGTKNVPPADLRASAADFAAEHGVVLLLKGHRTLITDGIRSVENRTGNPGMASGGSGDVLTGVIAALLGQGLSPFDAAHLGAHVHGLAGDLAAGDVGQVSLVASDLISHLPSAFTQLEPTHETSQ